jgi:peptide/nickel transport system substrate-binding protein
LFAVLLASLIGVAVLAQTGASARGQEGGILRVSFSPAAGLDYIDPALSFTQPAWSLLDATCARLYTYPDEPPPAGFRVEREVAASATVSDDLKTYTIKLRRGFRFSDGKPVRADAFAHAINRLLQLAPYSPGAIHVRDIVGAAAVLSGPEKTARGVDARGYTLVVKFSRPAPDFITRTTLPYFCAVPPGLPTRREGMGKFARPAPTTSASTARASGSRSGGTPSTEGNAKCTSTASASTSGAVGPWTSCGASTAARPTGAT